LKDLRSLAIQVVEGADQVKAYFDWANPILCVDPADPYMAENYPPDRVAREITEGRRCLIVARDGDAIVGGVMMKVFNDQDRGLRKITDQQPLVLIEYGAVHEDYRRQGLFTRLGESGAKWAELKAIPEIVAEIELSAIESLTAAFKNGFVATHLLPPSLGIVGPYLILRKKL